METGEADASGDSSATPTPTSGDSDTATPSPGTSAPASSSAPSSGTSDTGGGSTGSGGSEEPAGPGVCGTGQLTVGLRTPEGGGAAGSRYVLLSFTNKGSSPCYLDGHPGVSFVGKGDGTQLGTSADRVGTPRRVDLDPGESTSALLRIGETGNYDSGTCAPTTADGFRVYPPDSRASVLVRDRVQACQGKLGRGSSQLEVSPVGRSR